MCLPVSIVSVTGQNFQFLVIDIGNPFSHIALSSDDLTFAHSIHQYGLYCLGFLDIKTFFSTVSAHIRMISA